MWKVEFAARWAAFDIRFEAYGKELTDSVKINDWVAEHALKYPPPFHARYELFQDKSGTEDLEVRREPRGAERMAGVRFA